MKKCCACTLRAGALKSGVTHPSRYEPDINPSYQELAAHYGAAVLPARVRKPRDKAKVEVGVLLAQRWILARLRHPRFFSLAELNGAIRPLLRDLNARPFKKLPGSRQSVFGELDRPAIKPLPGALPICPPEGGRALYRHRRGGLQAG